MIIIFSSNYFTGFTLTVSAEQAAKKTSKPATETKFLRKKTERRTKGPKKIRNNNENAAPQVPFFAYSPIPHLFRFAKYSRALRKYHKSLIPIP